MKKIILLIIALTLCFALVACGEDDATCTSHVDADNNGKCDNCDATVEPSGDDGGETVTGEDLVLVTGTKTQFAVVCANSLSDKSGGYVNDFIKKLNRYYLEDQGLKTNYDAHGFDDAVEIIFGSPSNRGDQFKKDEHYLGYKGFAVELIGNKLFVLGGGDKGYQEAIKYLEDTLFDLEGYGNNTIDELIVPAGTKYESIPTNYDITEFTIAGEGAKNYVLTYTADTKIAKTAATILQEHIYKEAGVWIPYVELSKITDEQNVIYVEFTKGDASRRTDNGFTLYVKDGDLHIECEFENKFEEMIYDFIDAKLSSSKVKISADYTRTEDIRNIYYEDFGAVGDGETDDFFAIKACHEYANMWGHTVNGKKTATYYIGTANGKESIPVKTDTYWNLCSFIWDDRDVDDPGVNTNYQAPIFKILPESPNYSISGNKLPVTSLPSGSTTIGDWKPSEKVLVSIYDNTKRHYIRYGSNQNNGSAQNEIIIVYPDGSIDPDTPVHWDYTTLSRMVVYPAGDTPITFSGGTKDQVDDYSAMGKFDNYDAIDRAKIYTYFNDAPSAYSYFGRNIQITRSNVTLKNIQHILYDDVAQSAPYDGFIAVKNCSDVVIEGMIFQKQKPFSTTGADGGSVSMGSYEMNANSCNKVTWRHCRQSNFFEPDGSTKSRGNMGTNYCKNLKFEDMVTCSFDAHCNLYNGTIIDSVCEHLNFIGAGTIIYKDVTVYTDGNHAGISLRYDYGSTWDGDVIIDGLTLRTSKAADTISIFSVSYVNHYFGYTCHLPRKVELNRVQLVRYEYKVENGVRTEREVSINHIPIHLYNGVEKYKDDISDPDASITSYPNDYKKCNCNVVYNGEKSFNDTDGDGRCNNDLNPNDSYSVWCWGFEQTPDIFANANPYVPTEEIYITNCGNLEIIIPKTPQFKDVKVYIDGVKQNND